MESDEKTTKNKGLFVRKRGEEDEKEDGDGDPGDGGDEDEVIDNKVLSLERFLCEMIVTHGQRERNLLDQIATLHSDITNRSLGFQQTLAHYQKTRFSSLSSSSSSSNRTAVPYDLCDSDSGVGEDQLFIHLAVILNRKNGSLGFNVSGGDGGCGLGETSSSSSSSSPSNTLTSSSQPTAPTTKELVICKVNPDGPAHGKLCLQDRILKVNGIDLSSIGHDEAVSVIKMAHEPLVIEVVRQLSSPWPPRLCDVASQTDLTLLRSKDELCVEEETSEFSNNTKKYDIEFEEIKLLKEMSDSKLGLTISYTRESESSTDIFVEQVDPNGVAGRDGRIKEGDQVVQVNGVDVQDRKRAEELFESRCSGVSLLVARPRLKKDLLDDCEIGQFVSYNSSNLPQSILEEDGSDLEEEEYEGEVVILSEEDRTNGNNGAACDADKSDRSKVIPGQKQCSLDEPEGDKVEKSLVSEVTDAICHLNLNKKSLQSVSIVTKKCNTGSLSKSEAVEQWVKSTAAAATGENIRNQISASELCRGISLPPPPPLRPDDVELLSVACDCCQRYGGHSVVKPGSSCSSLTTLYTNRHNLDHTIQLQQQLFQRALLASSSSSSSGISPSSASRKTPSNPLDAASGNSSDNMEWKVKKRADGSRYVIRRPVRSKLLKDRASKLAEERCGMTTDDDAASEMKAGRYWNKEERKRHLERAKEKRCRKEELLRSVGAGKSVSDKGILELSRRKMTRIRGKNLFDNFTTVQEVLAHGSHVRTDGKVLHRLLSVTTV